ncbi:N-acyl-L-amino acid amidohydrolase [Intrasporangium oryzae NRRL B-24470]|uniref:N-acyl-L-amino acid amidohydrolase n=1 Tax=Intrasporangium oryzae NRRL B-24470 TaxID=1386089 RepID=W9GD54_9MICO|nr:amidohydrolase [Intrasporangium oryzae]EWT02763.1 N-acyl-L-amino acid amidohydrolase [Intrasporangium oryzae NRRL B-24470]
MTPSLPFDAIARSVSGHVDELVALRRDLHAHPELGRGEVRTTDLLAARLEAAGIAVRRLRGTGLVADIGAAEPAHTIALRADIDALPIREQTGLEFASRTDGISHSCGHDVHTTALVGAALALKSIEELLRATGTRARLVFQPAEEVMPGGAEDVVAQDGLADVERIFALHCDPTLDVGEVGLRVGPITAAADQVEVTLSGRGGHTSRPHLTQDLTYALAKVVTDVPAVLSRRLDPRAGAALVWGSVHSGGAHNVIPSSGKATGTLRMLDAGIWEGVERLLEGVVHEVVRPYAVTAEVSIVKGVPPVVNDASCIDALASAVTGAGAHVASTPQSLGGEDFAWYLTHVPGAMARLGTRTVGGPTFDLHRGDLVIDEGAIAIGARTLAGCVIASAAQWASEQGLGPAPSLSAVADR